MGKITKISTQKRPGYYNVFVDDVFVCGVSEADLVRLGLRKGQEVSAEELTSIQQTAELHKGYVAAMRYLSYRIRSTQEIRDHLKKKDIPSTQIDEIVHRLEHESYLNDTDFAQRWMAMRQAEARSVSAIRSELYKKGIAREIIEECFVGGREADVSAAVELIKKKRRLGKDDTWIQQFLARRGFSYTTTRQALDDSNMDRALDS